MGPLSKAELAAVAIGDLLTHLQLPPLDRAQAVQHVVMLELLSNAETFEQYLFFLDDAYEKIQDFSRKHRSEIKASLKARAANPG